MFRKRLVPPALLVLSALLILGIVFPAGAEEPLVPISGLSPYDDGGDPTDTLAVTACNGGKQIGVVYRNSETEPYIAVNPTNPDNLIACWHQDRWSTGAAQGVGSAYSMDGGITWNTVVIPFTRCSGAGPGAKVDFERASDPWLTFGPDGTCYYMALVADESTERNGMAVSWSRDGGKSWRKPRLIAVHDPFAPGAERGRSGNRGPDGDSGSSGDGDEEEPPLFVFHDKNSMTADPHDRRYVYATWTLFLDNETRIVFSRSHNSGRTWSAFREIANGDVVNDTTVVAFRQGAQIVVLPDGTLVNSFYRGLFNPVTFSFVGLDQAIVRSYDRGETWEENETQIARFQPTNGVDAERFFTTGEFLPVRDAGSLPDIAVNPVTGDLYVVWQDGKYRLFGASSVSISRSGDGGDTWSEPVPVNSVDDPPGFPGQSFLPSVTVADDGTVGVLYYDFRNDQFGDGPLSTDVFLATLAPDLTPLGETRVTPESFDMRQMVITGDRGFFPGDYVGFTAEGGDFVAAITVSNDLGLPVEFPQDNTILQVDSFNRQDILFARVPALVPAAARPVAEAGPRYAQSAAGAPVGTTAGFTLEAGAWVDPYPVTEKGRAVRPDGVVEAGKAVSEPAAGRVDSGIRPQGRVQLLSGPTDRMQRLRWAATPGAAYDVAVYDLQGRLVHRVPRLVAGADVLETAWDVRGVSNGIYFVRVSGEGILRTGRVLLVR